MISTRDMEWLKKRSHCNNLTRILFLHLGDHRKDETFNELDEKLSSEQTRIKQLLQALYRKNRELQDLHEKNQELQDEFEILSEDYNELQARNSIRSGKIQKISAILNPKEKE